MKKRQQQLLEIDEKIDEIVDVIGAAKSRNVDKTGSFFSSEYERAAYIANQEHQLEVLRAKAVGMGQAFSKENQLALINELMDEIVPMVDNFTIKGKQQAMVPYKKLIELLKKYGYDPAKDLPF